MELEQLGNDLVREHQCSVLCAYRSSSVSGPEHAGAFQRVCELHSSVLRAPDGMDVHTGHRRSAAAEVAAEFLPEPTAPRAARRFVIDTLRRWGRDPALAEDAQVVASQLATNAVIHAGSSFSVAVRSSSRGVRISVRDASRRLPVIGHEVSNAAGGRGLRLVAALASDWGVETTTHGKTVWAELAPGVPRRPCAVSRRFCRGPAP